MIKVTLANGGVLTLASTADPVDLTPQEADQIKSFVSAMRAIANVHAQTSSVTLNGGTLRVMFDGNWMKLDEDGRALFSAVSDLLAEFRSRQEAATPEAGRSSTLKNSACCSKRWRNDAAKETPMAGEHDFAPLSDEVVGWIEGAIVYAGDVGPEWTDLRIDHAGHEDVSLTIAAMAREIRAWRAAGRALVEAEARCTPASLDALRALVAHVGEGK